MSNKAKDTLRQCVASITPKAARRVPCFKELNSEKQRIFKARTPRFAAPTLSSLNRNKNANGPSIFQPKDHASSTRSQNMSSRRHHTAHLCHSLRSTFYSPRKYNSLMDEASLHCPSSHRDRPSSSSAGYPYYTSRKMESSIPNIRLKAIPVDYDSTQYSTCRRSDVPYVRRYTQSNTSRTYTEMKCCTCQKESNTILSPKQLKPVCNSSDNAPVVQVDVDKSYTSQHATPSSRVTGPIEDSNPAHGLPLIEKNVCSTKGGPKGHLDSVGTQTYATTNQFEPCSMVSQDVSVGYCYGELEPKLKALDTLSKEDKTSTWDNAAMYESSSLSAFDCSSVSSMSRRSSVESPGRYRSLTPTRRYNDTTTSADSSIEHGNVHKKGHRKLRTHPLKRKRSLKRKYNTIKVVKLFIGNSFNDIKMNRSVCGSQTQIELGRQKTLTDNHKSPRFARSWMKVTTLNPTVTQSDAQVETDYKSLNQQTGDVLNVHMCRLCVQCEEAEVTPPTCSAFLLPAVARLQYGLSYIANAINSLFLN